MDQQLGRLLRALEERGVLARTLVVAMSDHGEGLGEHGEGTHGLFVYDSTLKVPFIVAGPGIGGGRVAPTVARGIDVLPSLLDYAGLKPRPEIEGRSLRPAIEGREMSDAPAYAETLYPQREFGWAPLFAWRTARHKMIEAPRPELYDLEKDPGETANRAGSENARLAEMRQKLEVVLSRTAPSAAAEVDPEAAERLRALGYVAGGGGAPVVAGAALRDPKDGQRLVPRLNRGMSVVRTDPAAAIRDLTAVLAEDPGLLMARRSLAVAYTSAHQYERAIAELRRLEKDGILSAEDGIVLGDNLRFAGRLDEATAVLERTARENPRFAQPWISLAEVHVKKEKLAEAAAAYEHVLQMAPDHVEALRGLGDLALLRQQADEASRRYARILEIEPADAGAMTKLGVVRMRTGRPDEAVALFRRAIEREPENGEALLYLAGALASTGHPAEALPFFERALAAGQRNPMALNGLALTRMAVGDRKGAAAAFRESLRLDPDQPDVVAHALAETSDVRAPVNRRARAAQCRRSPLDHEGLPRLRRPARRDVGDHHDHLVAAGRSAVEGDAEAAGEGPVRGGLERGLRHGREEAPVAPPDREARGHARLAGGGVRRRPEHLEPAVQDPRGGELPPCRRLGRRRRALRRVAQPVGQGEARDPEPLEGRDLEGVEQASDRPAVAVADHDARLVASGRERRARG